MTVFLDAALCIPLSFLTRPHNATSQRHRRRENLEILPQTDFNLLSCSQSLYEMSCCDYCNLKGEGRSPKHLWTKPVLCVDLFPSVTAYCISTK